MSKLSECEKGYRRYISPPSNNRNNHFTRFKRHEIHVSRKSPKENWYIIVYAPSGALAYDGWWIDSAGKSVREAVEEAKRGACLTANDQDEPRGPRHE